jgi:hypothetical protein
MAKYDDFSSTTRNAKHAPKSARYREKRKPGTVVGVIARQAKDYKRGDFNPLVLFFTVSPYRKDLNKVIDQTRQQKKAKLPKYEESLFDSCFKKWGSS